MRMWWAVIRQAARDLRFGHESVALDAYEFMESTGKWMALTLFDLSPERFDAALSGLVARRSRGLRTSLLRP